jgi:hypothetical protein
VRRLVLHLSPCLLALALLNTSTNTVASVGTEGASFLDIPVGAGPASLGGAYAAKATDAYGLVWNPAGLAQINGPEMAAQHLSYLESINDEFADAAIPVRKGSTLAAGVQYLGSGHIQGTDNAGGVTTDFTNHYAAYSLAFGQAFGELFSLGVTGKWIEAQLSDVHARAYAFDIGSLYKATEHMALALTLDNIGTTLTFLNQADPLPMAMHAGLAYSPVHQWNLVLESVYRKSGLASAHTGLEWQPLPMIALRAGYRTDTLRDLSPLAGFTTGLAIRALGQELSYAWLPMGELGNTQYLSLLMKFGKSSEESGSLIYLPDVHRHRTAWSEPATVRDTKADESAWLEMLTAPHEN